MRCPELYREIGESVRLCRERAHLTQDELAERLGIKRTSISNIENGRQRIQVDTLYEMAKVFKIQLSVLFPHLGRSTSLICEEAISRFSPAEQAHFRKLAELASEKIRL